MALSSLRQWHQILPRIGVVVGLIESAQGAAKAPEGILLFFGRWEPSRLRTPLSMGKCQYLILIMILVYLMK